MNSPASAPEGPACPELTVALMAYNEAESLREVAEELLTTMDSLPCRAELLIVDDGSTDGSGAIADRLAHQHHAIRVLHHDRNLGLGGVYRTGFAAARGRYLTFFPADGQFPPQLLADFLAAMDSADLVLGYLAAREGVPLARALSLLERAIYRILVGPMPRFQGIFMVRREILMAIPLHSRGRGWGVVMEMILRMSRRGCRVVSRVTGSRPRRAGVSKVTNARSAWANLKQALALRQLLKEGD